MIDIKIIQKKSILIYIYIKRNEIEIIYNQYNLKNNIDSENCFSYLCQQ